MSDSEDFTNDELIKVYFNVPDDQLIELYYILFDVDIGYIDYGNFLEIVKVLRENGYDGDNNYQSMFWFIKGLKVNKPIITPKEASKLNENKPFEPSNVTLKPTQTRVLKFHYRPDINDKQLQNVFLRPLNPKVSQAFKDELNSVHKAFETMKKDKISYSEYKRIKNGDLQTELIDEITTTIYTNPTNWSIDFFNMSTKTREALPLRRR